MITLKRIAMGEHGTFGVLLEGDTPFALTLERPWLGNRKDVSCIPEGGYLCKRTVSPKFGNTFEVTGVEGRSHILFHGGNTAYDSQGCILVGSRFGSIGERAALLKSKEALSELMERLRDRDSFYLFIKNHFQEA
jgi:hypothetical protein